MSIGFAKDPRVFMQWDWSQIEPYADDLASRALTHTTLEAWMNDWSDLNRIISEIHARLWVATTAAAWWKARLMTWSGCICERAGR